MITDYIAVTFRNPSAANGMKGGWMLQPCHRVREGWWKYDRPIAGPFKTKREALEEKRRR